AFVAIYHFSAKVIQRAAGRSAVAAAAYRAGARLFDDRLGRTFNYSSKPGVIHSEIQLPEGAPGRWLDRVTLWNEVEAFERRKDAQLAREVELALPRELPPAEAIQLAQDFVRSQFVARGMVADLNIHWGTGPDGAAQPHAHVMLSLREISGEGFGKKQRTWNDRGVLRGWREDWAALVNERLAEAGRDIRIDHRSNVAQGIDLEPQNKIGPAGARRALRGEDAERRDEHLTIARHNGERILADPSLALAALTRQQSTFTRRDLARFINTHTADAMQFDAVMARVEASASLVRVGMDGRGRERFSTKELVAIERRMAESALALDARPSHPVDLARRQTAAATAGLGEEQALAFFHVTRARDLTVVCGIAGGGKSTLFGAVREVWAAQGYRVRGAALSGIAAEGLEQSTGIESRTLASLEYAWGQGKELLAANDILVVDEAGMLGSRQLGRLVETVVASGAKLVLSGDPNQLQAIEAGAALRAIAERVGAAEIWEPRRQREAWQREATRELASGRIAAALARYEAASMVHEHATPGDAETALAATWAAEWRNNPQQSRLMLTHTRASARTLNDLARAARRQAGELGEDRLLATAQGALPFAEGERIYFLQNDRSLGVKNGTLAMLEKIEGTKLTARLDGADGAKGEGRRIAFDLGAYSEIGHGYAATIHKSQGATVDVAHVLATGGMDRHLAYVALSRHRSGVHLHWSTAEFGTREALADRLGRERAKDSSLDYDEGEAVAAYAGRRGLAPLEPPAGAVVRGERLAAGNFQQEERLRELWSRLARDPGAARRNLQNRRIENALRPLLPALTQAVQRQESAASALGEAVAILDVLGEKPRPRVETAAGPEALAAGQAGQAPAKKRGVFAGLKLGTGRGPADGERKHGTIAAVKPPARNKGEEDASPPPLETGQDRGLLAMKGYVKAIMDVKRMEDMHLPIVEHQKVALRNATDALEAARPGATRDLLAALTHDPALGRVLAEAQGPELAAQLLAAIDRERQARLDPTIKAKRLAARWKVVEQD
ncbi:MAG: Ti-type conjugative transfer relaxase TraA, partial [Stellaceae bacterium]